MAPEGGPMSETRYDVIIIGSGAGGGTLAHELAGTGKQILLLERGGYLPREKDNWNSHAVFVDNKYKANETWHDKDGKPFHPEIPLAQAQQHRASGISASSATR